MAAASTTTPRDVGAVRYAPHPRQRSQRARVTAHRIPREGTPGGPQPGYAPSRTGVDIPEDANALVIAVDVERSGPSFVQHHTIAVGIAVVAVHPGRGAGQLQTLLLKREWGLLFPGTRFAHSTWKFWNHHIPELVSFAQHSAVRDAAAVPSVEFREVVEAFRSAAVKLRIPCHMVCDNPAGDFPALELWHRDTYVNLGHHHLYEEEFHRAPPSILQVTAGTSTLHTEVEGAELSARAALPLTHDSQGSWKRTRDLRSLQEGLIIAAQAGRGYDWAPITGHGAKLLALYDMPPDAADLVRHQHCPSSDAYETAHDYANVLCIYAGVIQRRQRPSSAPADAADAEPA